MAALYKLVLNLSWWLGVVCLVVGTLVKVAKPSGFQLFGTVTAHGVLFFACTLFLCTLATRAIDRAAASKP